MKLFVGTALLAIAATVAVGAPEDNGGSICAFTIDMATKTSMFMFDKKFRKELKHVVKKKFTNITKCWSPNVCSTRCHSYMSGKIMDHKCEIHTIFRCSLSAKGECGKLNADSLVGQEVHAQSTDAVVVRAAIVGQHHHHYNELDGVLYAEDEIDKALYTEDEVNEETTVVVGLVQ